VPAEPWLRSRPLDGEGHQQRVGNAINWRDYRRGNYLMIADLTKR
jgi:hypothetical protein